MVRLIATLWIAALAATASGSAPADSFDVRLGGRVIGHLEATETALSSTLDNTPLGAADGWFKARVEAGDYLARNSEGRDVSIRFDAAGAVTTEVAPPDDRTALSEAEAAPAHVIDPITGFAQVMRADDCPAPFRMYDGRRAMRVKTERREIEGGELVCIMSYLVTDGPGHVSPFRLTRLAMEARYALTGGAVAGLNRLRVSAGPFSVDLARR